MPAQRNMAYSKKQIESIFKEICKQISEDGLSLRAVLRKDDMPSSHVFYEWIDDNEIKQKRYARACALRADLIFDDILIISDATEDDIIISEDGIPITNHNVIQRDKLRTDNRRWIVSKMNPKKYGDRLEQDITIKGTLNYTTEERDKRIKDLLKKKDAK